MSRLENSMNFLTDQDWGWRPFLFLRPEKDRDIDNVVLLKMASCFGPSAVLVALLVLFLLGYGITARDTSLFVAGGWIAFFIGYKFTFAIFWNRRAKRLRSLGAQSAPET
jgi:hypothetical protein